MDLLPDIVTYSKILYTPWSVEQNMEVILDVESYPLFLKECLFVHKKKAVL
jgi:hypothetical protein